MNTDTREYRGASHSGAAPKRYLILLAAGSGKRAGGNVPKQFRKLKGTKVYIQALMRFLEASPLDGIVVVVAPGMEERVAEELATELADYKCPTPKVVAGGESRFQSVDNGLAALGDAEGLVAIHDSARPVCPSLMILRGWTAAALHGAAIPVVPVSDSLRRVGRNGASASVRRSDYVAVQTPQVFDLSLIRRAYDVPEMCDFTDDASVAEAAGIKVETYEGDVRNIKITYPSDLKIAKALL